ncbi:MAG TPA: hypothetical protein VFI43_01730 [Nitrosospira sp.]|nr:hypothetical protein [Nitrosospira sp.]
MNEHLKILVTLLVTPLVTGCAQIKYFSVAPTTICPGEAVQVDWKASDRVLLSTLPPLPGTGEGPPEGSLSFTPVQDTRFTLKVPALLKSAQREWDVSVIPAQSSRLMGGVAQCSGNPASVSATFSVQQKDTSSRVRVTSIQNNYQRTLKVGKDNVEAEIAPGTATDQFKNVPVSGTWTIRAPVAGGETCDSVLDSVRSRLTINVQMSCKE